MTMPPVGAHSGIPAPVPGGGEAAHSAWADFDVEACYRYVCSRQTSEGGFCFYAYPQWGVEDPNAPDTCAAVQIFGLLGAPTPAADKCIAWLAAQQDAAGGFQTAVIGHAALKALRLLRAEPRRSPQQFLCKIAEGLHIAAPNLQNRDGWLVSALRCIELWRCHDMAVTAPMRAGIASALKRLRRVDGGFGAPASNLLETATALTLATAVGLSVDADVLAYARRCEGGPLGFNITPFAISSSVETQLSGLQVLRHFGAQPQCAVLIREFAKSCQTPLGGFGRTPGAIARLDDTLHALQILVILGELEAKEEPPKPPPSGR